MAAAAVPLVCGGCRYDKRPAGAHCGGGAQHVGPLLSDLAAHLRHCPDHLSVEHSAASCRRRGLHAGDRRFLCLVGYVLPLSRSRRSVLGAGFAVCDPHLHRRLLLCRPAGFGGGGYDESSGRNLGGELGALSLCLSDHMQHAPGAVRAHLGIFPEPGAGAPPTRSGD